MTFAVKPDNTVDQKSLNCKVSSDDKVCHLKNNYPQPSLICPQDHFEDAVVSLRQRKLNTQCDHSYMFQNIEFKYQLRVKMYRNK